MANGRIKATLLFATGVLLAQNSRDLVVHVEVNLVQVDAIVTDGKGKPVTDLTAADFEIFQDGKPQSITNFSYVDTTGGAGVAPRALQVKGAPPLPAVNLQPADVRRTFIVVVDDLGVSWENLPAIKHACGSSSRKRSNRQTWWRFWRPAAEWAYSSSSPPIRNNCSQRSTT